METMNDRQRRVFRILPMITRKLDRSIVKQLVDMGMATVEDSVVYPRRKNDDEDQEYHQAEQAEQAEVLQD
jgi:endonuclease YncB( thermonuclease family)